MGLFDIFKKKQKADPEEAYKDKSIDELAKLIREQKYPDGYLCSAYAKKLLRAPIEEGGLGFSDDEIGKVDPSVAEAYDLLAIEFFRHNHTIDI